MESTLTSYHALDQVLRKKETWAKVSSFLGGGGGGVGVGGGGGGLGAGADAGLGERTFEIWGGGGENRVTFPSPSPLFASLFAPNQTTPTPPQTTSPPYTRLLLAQANET